MKMQKTFSFILLSFTSLASFSQTINDYALVPGPSFLLPAGEKMNLSIQWFELNGTPHKGISDPSEIPEWTINGHAVNNLNKADGDLSIDLGFGNATYTTPDFIPATNPVTIAVRFHPNDSTKELITLLCNVKIIDPGNKWYISYTYTGSGSSSEISQTEEHTKSSHTNASVAMLVRAAPPQEDGSVIINTGEGDSLSDYSISGNMAERISDVSRYFNGEIEERTLREYTGQPAKEKPGIEFQYDPAPDGVKGLAGAGINFKINGTEKFWKPDINTRKLKETDEVVTDQNGGNILLGSSKDILKKTKDGFTIDNTTSKDTTYTDILGKKYASHTSIEYHMVISRRKIKDASPYKND